MAHVGDARFRRPARSLVPACAIRRAGTLGVALAYNLVRLEMMRIAEEAGVPPKRISFIMALRLIRDEWAWATVTSPGAIPRHLRELRAEVARFVLPPRRTERSYPRAVKLKMSNYARKRPVAKDWHWG